MASANEKLCDAAWSGDVAEIERQIAAGANPNAFEGTDGWTPLQRAAVNGHLAAIAALLKAGAHVDGADTAGNTPLLYAAASCHTAAVDTLLAAGADMHHVSIDGTTALHCASANGRLEAARVLLEAGARAHVRNKCGDRPIDVVRAPLDPSLRLRDFIALLLRPVHARRCAEGFLQTRPTRPPCARCWSGRQLSGLDHPLLLASSLVQPLRLPAALVRGYQLLVLRHSLDELRMLGNTPFVLMPPRRRRSRWRANATHSPPRWPRCRQRSPSCGAR
jgi:hypothetical protein